MHDLVIIGAGPAGLSASIYASRYKLNHILLGKEIGGYLSSIHKIDNYPALPGSTGFELAIKMKEHVEKMGGKVVDETAKNIARKEDGTFVVTTDQNAYETKNIIFAVGSKSRQLNIPGEKELLGKGVCYCATCDAPFYKNKTAVVVGGGNAAADAVLVLSKFAEKIYLLAKEKELLCSPSYVDQMNSDEKITILTEANITKINGNNKVESIDFTHQGKEEKMDVQGIFIEIGSEPNIGILEMLGVELNKDNFVITGPDQATNVPGIYAAGDVTTNSNGFRQIITATAEGAVAVMSLYDKMKSKKN